MKEIPAAQLRKALVATALEWQRRYGVAPAITSAISEYDAALLVGHTPKSLALDCTERTAVTRGTDFRHNGLRYQIKANRPSGKKGSAVTLVAKAKNYEWDRLVWLLYDKEYQLQGAWEWTADAYQREFHKMKRLGPDHMTRGRSLVDPPGTTARKRV